jgi:hypothetical protein
MPGLFQLHGRRLYRPVDRERRRGQTTVEFALILPVFLLLTVGIVDLARMFSTYGALIDGVREAALYAGDGPRNNLNWCFPGGTDPIPCPSGASPAIHATSPDPDNIAFHINSSGLVAAQVEMADPVCEPDPCVPGGTVKVSASYRVPLLTPILGTIFGGSILISATTTARVLQ